MSRLAIRTIGDAPEETQASLKSVQNGNGYLPNLLRILTNAPIALEAYLTTSGINTRGSLSITEREAAQSSAAAAHG